MIIPEDGAYIVSETIANPTPDRRSHDWRCQPTLPAGRYLVTSIEREEDFRSGAAFMVRTIYVARERSSSYRGLSLTTVTGPDGDFRITDESAAIEALAAVWERDESVEGFLRHAVHDDHELSNLDLLLYLVDAKILRKSTLQAAILGCKERTERRYEELERREAERVAQRNAEQEES